MRMPAHPARHAMTDIGSRWRAWCLLPAAVWLGLVSSMAMAQVGTAVPDTTLDLRLRAGLNHTDNLGRIEEGESQTFGSLGTEIALRRTSRRFEAGLQGALDYQHYDSDIYSNEVVGRLDARLGLALLPERIDWLVENQFGQVRTDPFSPDRPDNREILNVFQTGPDFYLPLSARTSLRASGRYADRRWERSDELDSDIRSGSFSMLRQLSPTQTAGVTAAVRRIEFDADPVLAPAYEVQSAYATYRSTLATGEAGVDLGANRLKRAGESQSGLLVRLNWARDFATRSRLSLEAGREFRDAGDQFSADALDGIRFDGAGSLPLGAEPLTATFGAAVYRLEQDRTSYTLAGRLERNRYEAATSRDRDISRVEGGARYQFSPALSGGLRLRFSREDFVNVAGDSIADEVAITASVERRIGRQWDVAFAYTYTDRSSDLGTSFDENRFRLNLVWTPSRR